MTSAGFSGFLTPPFIRNSSTVCPQNWPIFGPPPPFGADIINESLLKPLLTVLYFSETIHYRSSYTETEEWRSN